VAYITPPKQYAYGIYALTVPESQRLKSSQAKAYQNTTISPWKNFGGTGGGGGGGSGTRGYPVSG
jgi:hypothetical protein